MSRKLLAFFLKELNVVRFKCMNCNGVIEIAPDKVAEQFSSGSCPLCRKLITVRRGDESPFAQLCKAISSLRRLSWREQFRLARGLFSFTPKPRSSTLSPGRSFQGAQMARSACPSCKGASFEIVTKKLRRRNGTVLQPWGTRQDDPGRHHRAQETGCGSNGSDSIGRRFHGGIPIPDRICFRRSGSVRAAASASSVRLSTIGPRSSRMLG